jgi:hypothetical protein
LSGRGNGRVAVAGAIEVQIALVVAFAAGGTEDVIGRFGGGIGEIFPVRHKAECGTSNGQHRMRARIPRRRLLQARIHGECRSRRFEGHMAQ